MSINPFIIKEVLKTYSDKSFMNYQKICKEYNHLYHNTIKKLKDFSGDKLRANVKKWFFEQSLESRIKLCTVENEFICQIIYQMYHYTRTDKSTKFIPKAELTDISEINQKNTLNNFKNFSQFDINYFFICKPDSDFHYKYNKSMASCYGEEENDKKYNSSIDEFINEIKFYSVHHKPDPDCFCLSPNFLLKEERFDTTFNYLGNINYFSSLIKPYYNIEKNIYSYMLPDWFGNFCSFSITQYIFGFIEQAIMIKYILNNFIKKKNKNYKSNSSIFSLIDDENLNDVFNVRKMVINYININYSEKNSKKQLVNDSKIENIFDKYSNYDKVLFFKEFRKDINYRNLSCSLLVQPFYGNNNYIFNTLYDGIYSSASNNNEQMNKFKLSEIKCKINEVIDRTDNITFIDYLLFQNFKEIWDIEYFINFELIEYFIYIAKKQNENDLLKLKEDKKPSKKRRKKKKKNNNEVDNNINDITEINNKTDKNDDYDKKSKENENNLFNIELECYKELFKQDEEKLLYVPYYFSNNLELKNLYKKKFNNKLKIIEKNNNKNKDKKEIINYIRNDFLLKYIINKVVCLQPDNYVSFFGNNDKKIINNNIEDKPSKISGLKLRKPKNNSNSPSGDNFGTITINLNPNRIINKNESSNNSDNDNNDDNNDNDINDNYNNKDKLNEKNKIINKDNKIRINSKDKKSMNNLVNTTEEKNEIITNTNNFDNTNEYSITESSNKNNNSDSKIKNDSKNKNIHKKREKSPNIFFLFDTVKNKNKNKKKSKNIKSEKNISQNNKSSKINGDLSFNEKLHNSILKNEKKVNNILQLLIKYKNYCVEEIKKLIKKTYDDLIYDYSIGLYGSFITGLMIEASDIDIRIKINNCKNPDFEKYFFTLYNKLEEEKKFETITPISTASIPVIKLVINIEKFIANQNELEIEFNRFKQLARFKNYLFDKNELLQIKIDITFIINKIKNNKNENNLEIANKTQNDKLNLNSINVEENNNQNELSSVSYIKRQLEEYPEIKPILMLLKRYFYIKKMNSSFEGGLSSYNLFLLILSFAKYQSTYNSNSNEKNNLGYFLIQFLEFFGKIFDFKNYLININSPYIYLNNYDIYSCGKSLMILDPLTGFNASKSSFKIDEIQKTFLSAYNFFEKEKINYENDIDKNETNDKRNHDKNNNCEVILGLTKIHKNDYNKNNNKENKINSNIIDKFFCT